MRENCSISCQNKDSLEMGAISITTITKVKGPTDIDYKQVNQTWMVKDQTPILKEQAVYQKLRE